MKNEFELTIKYFDKRAIATRRELWNKIADLQSQLQQANEIINNPDTLIFQQQQLICSLQSQLAKKETLLKKYVATSCPIKQDKISFAVDILEELAGCSNYINSKLDFECSSYVSEKAIRDKIKYLKGKKDE